MASFANIELNQQSDGFAYSTNVPLTGQEVDLSSFPAQANLDPLAVKFGRAFVATVLFKVVGSIPSGAAYVVAQGSNDGVSWFDMAWCQVTLTTGTALFVLSGGTWSNNAFQQTRAVGTAPGSNGSNAVVLPGQIRFVGKWVPAPSSSSSGAPSGLFVTISVKVEGNR